MKRLLMYDPYHYGYFGAQRGMVDLALGLQRDGFEPVIATGREGILCESARKAGIPVEVIRTPDAVNVFDGQALKSSPLRKLLILAATLHYSFRVSRVVARQQFDVLYANDLRAVLFLSVSRLLLGKRLIWRIQGGPAFGLLSAFGAWVADEIVVISNASAKAIPPAVRKRVRNKISVNYVGIDTSSYLPKATGDLRAEFRKKYGLPQDGLLIASAGSISHRKGFDTLLAALEMVHADAGPVHVAVAGTPEGAESSEYFDKLKAHVAEKSLPVTFVGWLNDLRELLAASDIFVLASREEGLGIVILEAMATGLPAIVTEAGGSEETVVDGESGLVVQPDSPAELAERLRFLLGDGRERARLGANARRRSAEVFSIGVHVSRFSHILQNGTS